MMTRIVQVVRAVVVLPVAVALAVVGWAPAAHGKPRPAPPTPAFSPPPREASPFSTADQFCVRTLNTFETTPPTDPQLRTEPAEVVWLTAAAPNGAPSREDAAIDTFARLVAQCGGIGGRPLDVHVVHDSGNPASDCTDAIARFHPVIVVSKGLPHAWSCIVHDQRTVLLTGSDVSNAELTGAGGRLVAAGSSEGVQQARLLGLVDSGRLDDRKVAIVAGNDAAASEFRQAALTALATKRIRPVTLADADAVLAPTLDLGTLPFLQASTAPKPSHPLDVYSFDTADASVPVALAEQPAATARQLEAVRLYAFSPVTDPTYQASREPNTFSGMCNQAVVDEVAKRAGPTTTTTEPRPPLGDSYLTTADVCLLSRIVARALFAAGPTLDQRAVITALHRLPYVDQVAPGGTPRPRPNQVVNEAVRRIEQVVVLDQVQSDCPMAPTSTTKTTVGAPAVFCWMPAPGFDGGGAVVNVPLPAATIAVRH